MRFKATALALLLGCSAFAFVACEGDTGPAGADGADGTSVTPTPTPTPAVIPSTWTKVSTGGSQSYVDQQPGGHTCAIASDGTLWCWGSNDWGQLGDGSYVSSSTPVQVGTETNWMTVDAKGNHTCGIRGTTKGSLWCWGQNYKKAPEDSYDQGDQGNGNPGLLGLGRAYDETWSVPSPTQVGTDTDWASLGLGHHHGCGIRDDGTDQTLWCWGSNGASGLGNGSGGSSEFANEPVQEDGTYTDWTSVKGATVGYCSNTTAGIRNGNEIWAVGCDWGYAVGGGSSFALDADSTADGDTTGDADWASFDMSGGGLFCGIKSAGSLWCTGNGDHGQNGSGAFSAVTVADQVGTDTTWTDVATGRQSVCGVNGGDLYCWGRDHLGELGLGEDVSANAECADNAHGYSQGDTDWDCNAPLVVDAAQTWASVDVGRSHACALTTGGSLYCWGANGWGQTGSVGAVWTPTQVQ
ncbi:MAG TPA: hypothetical protein VI895_08100 [Bdellovibrionota bacterium]|nr:hypothetical protein [Bdellovibrionota bacterium]